MGELRDSILRDAGFKLPTDPMSNVKAAEAIPRVGAGLINTVKDIGPGLYALPDVAHDLYDIFINKVTPPEGREHLPGARAAQKWIVDTDAAVREAVGLPPEDPIETGNIPDALLENVPGVLLPFGAAAKMAQVSKLPKAVQTGAKVLSTVAGAPTTKLGKVVAGTAIGGANVGMIKYLESQGAYDTPAEPVRNNTGEVIDAALPVAAPATPTTSLRDSILADAQATGQMPAQPSLRESILADAQAAGFKPNVQRIGATERNRIIAEAVADRQLDEGDGFTWKDAALMGSGMAALLYGGKGMLSKVGQRMLRGSAKFGLNEPEVSKVGKAAQVSAGWLDQDAPITSTLRSAGDDVGADFVDMSRPGGSHEARVRAAVGTGQFAGSTTRIPSLSDDVLRARHVSPQQREVFVEGVRAGDKLTSYAKDPKRFGLGNESVSDLQAKVHAAERDTGVVGQLFRNYREMSRGLAQLRYEHGLIDRATRDLWMRPENYHMPRIARDSRGVARRAFDALTSGTGRLKSPIDARLKYNQVPDDVKLIDPHSAMQQYIMDTIKEIDDNNYRRLTINALLKTRPKDVRVAKRGDPDTISVMNNGKGTSYFVDDPILRRALKDEPNKLPMLLGVARTMNNLYTMGTTGALNPMQAARAFLYDPLAAVATAPKQARYTPTVAGFDVGLVPGIGQGVAVGQAAVGSAALMRATLARQFSQVFKNYAYKGGVLGPMADKLAKRMGKAFENSTMNMMEQYGAISTRLMHSDQIVPNTQTVLNELAPMAVSRVPKAMTTYNIYHGLLDSLQNGARAFYFMKYAKKLPKDADAHAELIKIAARTRQLTGDFGKGGTNPWNVAARAAIPYWNPSMQSFRAMGNAMRKDPVHFTTWVASTMATAAGAAYMMFNESPEHAKWFKDQVSMSDKNRFIWLPKPGAPPEQSFGIPVPPEMQPLIAAGVTYMETMYDAYATGDQDAILSWDSLGESFTGPKATAQFGEAIKQVIPVSSPALMSQLFSLGGYKMPIGRFTPEQVYESPYDSSIPPWANNVGAAVLGTFGATFMKALDEGALRATATGGDLSEAAGAAGESIVEDVGHYTPMLAPLWGHNRKATGGTYDSQVFSDQSKDLERVQGTIQNIKDYLSGTMGSGIGQGPNLSQKLPLTQMDQQTVFAFMMADKVSRKFDKYRQVVNSKRGEIAAIQNRNDLSPKDKAELSTRLLREIQTMQVWITKANTTAIEDRLAKIYGKPMTIRDLAEMSTMSSAPLR